MRGYSITGGATRNYLAAVHEEPTSDPLWTICYCMTRTYALKDEQDFAFGWPGLHGGKGLILKPTRKFIWLWKGAVHAHGGVFAEHTREALESKEGTTYEHLTIAMYQKQGPLDYGHRYLTGAPTQADVHLEKLDRQYEKHALSWMA